MSYSEYDLGSLADKLAAKFPSIDELYLFGSRRYSTKSPRSDIDILVVSNKHIRPAELREFADDECTALDLFIVDDSKAISTQNESYVEADSFHELVSSLNAVVIWSKEGGRTSAPIEWIIQVDDDVVFERTMLPSKHISEERATELIDFDKVTVWQILKSLKPGQAWATLAAVITVAVFVAGIGYKTGRFVESKTIREPAYEASVQPRQAEEQREETDSYPMRGQEDLAATSRESADEEIINAALRGCGGGWSNEAESTFREAIRLYSAEVPPNGQASNRTIAAILDELNDDDDKIGAYDVYAACFQRTVDSLRE